MSSYPNIAEALNRPHTALPAVILRRTRHSEYATPDGRYVVRVREAADGYRTFRYGLASERHGSELCTLREVRESIAAHIASDGGTWNASRV